jgi:hypothetical protein
MPWPEYVCRVAEGQLADPGEGFIMPAFEAAHPEHPMAGANRFTRIGAADGLRDAARERTEPFPAAVLEVIHACLLDCCAAVRSSLALALFQAGDEASVGPLTELLRLESSPEMPGRSKMVRRFAGAALGRCAARGNVQFPVGRPLLLCLATDAELAADLGDLAQEHGLHLHQSHTAIDLIALTPVVQVVDLTACRPEDWAAFRCYLEEAETGRADTADEPATPDGTPLLLMNCRESGDRMDAGLAKPKGTVFRFGVGCRDMVLQVITHALASRRASGGGPITVEMIGEGLESLQR